MNYRYVNTIPDIIHPLGKHWKQPSRDKILIDDTHAMMDIKTFKELANYSCSRPSGVYEGKMWKMADNYYQQEDTNKWWLVWYDYSALEDSRGNRMVDIRYREIIII